MSAAASRTEAGGDRLTCVGPLSGARVVWIEFPEELRRICEPYVLRELPLLPRWVTELRVQFDPCDSSGLWTRINHEYRNGRIAFCGQWFGGNEQYRRSSLRHEFAHFALEPVATFARELIDSLAPDDRFKAHLREQLRKALEMSTCDVEEMLGVALTLPDERV